MWPQNTSECDWRNSPDEDILDQTCSFSYLQISYPWVCTRVCVLAQIPHGYKLFSLYEGQILVLREAFVPGQVAAIGMYDLDWDNTIHLDVTSKEHEEEAES